MLICIFELHIFDINIRVNSPYNKIIIEIWQVMGSLECRIIKLECWTINVENDGRITTDLLVPGQILNMNLTVFFGCNKPIFACVLNIDVRHIKLASFITLEGLKWKIFIFFCLNEPLEIFISDFWIWYIHYCVWGNLSWHNPIE